MTTYNVSNITQYNAALKLVKGGDTISLAGGEYGALKVQRSSVLETRYNSEVTIKSADPDNPAVITSLLVQKAANVTLDGLSFEGRGVSMPFLIESSTDITVKNSDFTGVLSGGYGTGMGLRLKNTTGATIEDNTFTKMSTSLWIQSVDDLHIKGNDFTEISTDAMQLGRINDAVIEDNTVSMNTPITRDHKDMIQFYNDGVNDPSTNILIQNNTLIANEIMTHGIYMGNELSDDGFGPETFYEDITITGNVIVSGQLLAIAVGGVDGLTITDNEVLKTRSVTATNGDKTPYIVVQDEAVNVTITDNITLGKPYGTGNSWQKSSTNPDWVISNNTIVPASTLPGTVDPSDIPVYSGPGNGKVDEFRVKGTWVSGETSHEFSKVHFGEGDYITLIFFDNDTFLHQSGGNTVWANLAGNYVKIDSMADIEELVQYSPDISATITGDDLVVNITQNSGIEHMTLKGLASSYNGAVTAPPVITYPANEGNGVANNFNFKGTWVDGDTEHSASNIVFDEGDTVTFIYYDNDTFRYKSGGNYVAANLDGNYVKIDSMVDLQELVTMSSKMSASTSAGDLIIEITQSNGTHSVTLDGLGQEYQNTFDSALF